MRLHFPFHFSLHFPHYTVSFVILGSLILLWNGCFTPITEPPDLPYDERVVIRAILMVGEPMNEIQISRTLPPLDTFSYRKIFIENAKASITVDGQVLPLELYTRNTTGTAIVRSLYRVPNMRTQPGKLYTLNVEWQSPTTGRTLRASAETRTPSAPLVDSARVIAAFRTNTTTMRVDTIFASEAFVQARAQESMRVGTLLLSGGQVVSSRGYGDASFIQSSASVSLRSNDWTLPRELSTATVQLLSGFLQSRVVVETYDTDYNKYFQTRNRSGQPSPLNPGGPNIDWNVKGDGIGMFIGAAQWVRVVPVRRVQ
ncbi:MAG: DUF4249 family protein [Candidatus Kapaibacterium sp.]|nr:MAG: DUF4249 family protein [Candidatus Kapabacteria bacterium]